MKHTVILIIVLGLLSPKTMGQNSTPKDLGEAISYFERIWSITEKENFRKLPERNAVIDLHFSTGMWIRNNWIHGDRDTSLVHYFNNLGIYHPDDISSIILISLHRKLNNKEIGINQQVEKYKAYWKPYTDCNELEKKRAIYYYNKFKVSDTITIKMLVDTSFAKRSVKILQCPHIDWDFNPDKDIKITGIVTEKYFFNNDSSNLFFNVLIEKINFKNTMMHKDILNEGDIKKFWTMGLKFE